MTKTENAAEVAVETVEPDVLSAEEQAYFETGGDAEIPAETVTEQQEDAVEPEKAVAEGEGKAEPEGKAKTVPHQALHAEREEHKKTRSELNEMREKWARLEERMTTLTAPKQEPEETPPDPNEDIFAYSAWQAKKLETLEQQFTERRQQEQQTAEQQKAQQAIWSHWETDVQRYGQENPDFGNAAKWLSETRDKQLQAFAGVDPTFSNVQARNAQIEKELAGIIVAASQRGQSAAEAVYQIAQQWGYAPQAGEDQGKEAAEKLEKIAKAQDASKTIGNASGRAGGDEITAETLAGMSDSEFSAWISKPENERKFARIMGA